MSVIVISDVHAQIFWKKFAAKKKEKDRLVFLGDYFDNRGQGPWANDETENFLEICDFARKNPDTVMLIGNHDWHYLPWDSEGCSGRNNMDLPIFRKALTDNLDLLNMVFVDRSGTVPLVYSHGGVCLDFMNLAKAEKPEDLNSVWRENPEIFNWQPLGPNGEISRLDGDNTWQSPLWTRVYSLYRDSIPGYNQVVGHTPVTEIRWLNGNEGEILLTCTLDDRVAVIDNPDDFRKNFKEISD